MGIFTLDVSVLGGGESVGIAETIIPSGDRGRGIQLEWDQDDLDGGMELLGYSVRFAPAETEAKEIV